MGDISFLRGVPARDSLEHLAPTVASAYRDVLSGPDGARLLQYRIPGLTDWTGHVPLRQALGAEYGLDAEESVRRVVCSNGGMEVVTFLLLTLARPSRVAVEALTYDRALHALRHLGHEVVGIPFTDEGVDLDALRQTLAGGDVELFYRVIYHQNPTGRDSTPDNIAEAARLCAEAGVLYVCDAAYLNLRYDGRPNQRLDLGRRPDTSAVVGSFTKTLSPGTKCGYGIFPAAVVERMTTVIANLRLNPNYPTQAMIHRLVAETGGYQQHLDYLVELYRPRMQALNEAVASELPDAIRTTLTGGFFAGIWLPGIDDDRPFLDALRARGVLLDRADVFATEEWRRHDFEQNKGRFFRLTFPSLSPEDVRDGIHRLAAVYREHRR